MKQLKDNIITFKPISGICCLIIGFFTLFALLDYQPARSNFYNISAIQNIKCNRLGSVGVSFCFYSCRYIGATTWLIPFYLIIIGIEMLIGLSVYVKLKRLIIFFVCLIFGSITFAFLQNLQYVDPRYEFYSAGRGGLLGVGILENGIQEYFGSIGCGLLIIPLFLIFLSLSFPSLAKLLKTFAWNFKALRSFLVFFSKKIFVFKKLNIRKCIGILYSSLITLYKFLLKIFRCIFFYKKKINDGLNGNSTEDFDGKITNLDNIGENNLNNSNNIQSETNNKYEIARYNYNPQNNSTDYDNFHNENCHNGFADIEESYSNQKLQNCPIKVLNIEKLEQFSGEIKSDGNYKLPSLDLLDDPPNVNIGEAGEDYYQTAKNLVQKLDEFGVEVKVDAIQSGPVITRYEVTPARGVRVEKIVTLDKNIALGLKALSVRIQAPVPGKGCVGIEVPNKKPLPVCLKEILASKDWNSSNAEIPIVLGKEVTGKPIIADLTKMPHLLIAGSTGSGKTVCINAIIASLIFRMTPKNLRFIMVDPKIVEMKIYNDLPHMLIPVVTEPKKVPGALKWLIAEMDRRYQLFSKYGARNIVTFNEKLAKVHGSEGDDLEHLPYIVCIIDELADLMMVAPGDIETSIARLSQLARASGIHLIIATQRPSVNVITGIIKANLPSRIAFKVASKVDSRTILDVCGADALIGKGDMLFIPPGAAQLIRAQGAWVSDDEINALVEFLKINGTPMFVKNVQSVIEQSVDTNEDTTISNGIDDDDETLIPQAISILQTSDKISISLLQRKLKIGYNRAARIMDTLNERSLIPTNIDRS